ncbi:MAG: IPT/TIG domain-containing protein [Myxococcaceae bacterium]|jgi:hypothetical protein|nr:IPT/TIG domain-containing protein [Myxococcaceae bacterium]MCA3016795.1 IPT/TIG domain-containing protein [Myxococcaceae bacterium]
MRRVRLVVLTALSACTDATFAPETLVKDLRVLSVQAEPPEVAPGELSRLSVLKSDAAPGVPTSVIWVGCEPDPQDLGRSACNDAEILLRPTQITDYPAGLQLLGFGLSAGYRSTPGVFEVLPPEDPVRRAGSVGQVLALVIGEDVDPLATGEQLRGYFERIEQKLTPVVVALTRVLVSQKPAAERNRNPGIVALSIDGGRHPVNGRVGVLPGQQVALTVAVPDDVRQTYTVRLSTGDVTRTEKVVGAWYSSGGRFGAERFDTETGEAVTFTAPGSAAFPDDPVPERRQGTLWLVVRDDRGGQSFERYPFFVCDPSLPNPVVQSITPPTAPGGQVVVTGENLASVLDVVVGDVALGRGGFVAASQTYVGDAPAVPPGSYVVTVKSRSCQAQTTTLRYAAP